jgi:CO/xanthine dehydrogenase Mo-binding subunit
MSHCRGDRLGQRLRQNAQLWDEANSDATPNVCVDAQVGDAAATEAAFARAAHVVKLTTWIQRVTGVPMEPRAAVGSYDPASGRTTLHAGSGGVVRQKHELATVLGVPMERVRVVSGDVGGNFGTRNAFYPEFALVAWASRRVGRPVKWTCDRQEAFLSDYQGRDLFVEAELALDESGNFLAVRQSRQPRRPQHQLLHGAEGRRDHIEHLPGAGRPLPRARRAQQQLADPPIPQRRQAGSHFRH